MKVFLRISKGWSKPVENHNKERCDVDGAKLWVGPGNQVYCDVEHDPDDVKSVLETGSIKRAGRKGK
jgi:hypothetical protein